MSFSYNTIEQEAVLILALKGKITSEGDVRELQNDPNIQRSNIIVDLSECSHINSSAINFLIRNLTRCRVAGGELIICGMNENIMKLFNLAKITGLFNVYPIQEEAIKHFK